MRYILGLLNVAIFLSIIFIPAFYSVRFLWGSWLPAAIAFDYLDGILDKMKYKK